MDPNIITDDQVEAFERDGVVTVDTPWSGKLIEDVSEIMDRQLPLYVNEMTPSSIPEKQGISLGKHQKATGLGWAIHLRHPTYACLKIRFWKFSPNACCTPIRSTS